MFLDFIQEPKDSFIIIFVSLFNLIVNIIECSHNDFRRIIFSEFYFFMDLETFVILFFNFHVYLTPRLL